MREIKFRAWNDLDRRMIDFATFKENPDLFMNIIKGRKCFTLMQYTGLKDEKGVEIYESDIVARGGDWNRSPMIGVVEFTDCGRWIGSNRSDYDDLCDFNAIVIGNVHENMELLNEK